MITVKESQGLIYVADIGPSRGNLPGEILKDWVPVGPGERPVVTDIGDAYYITFEYLGHVHVRKMDAAIWPPQVVDPVVYHDNYVSLEQPQDALSFGFGSTAGDAQIHPRPMLAETVLKRLSGLIYNVGTGEFTTTITRDTAATNPAPATRAGFRVYQRVAGGTWERISDWVTEIPTLTVKTQGSMHAEFAATYGHLWTPETRNANGTYLESDKGPALIVNSDVESWTLEIPVGDTSGVGTGIGTTASVQWEPSIAFNSLTAEDVLPLDPRTSSVGEAAMEPIRTFLAVDALPQAEVIPVRAGAAGTFGSVAIYS